jgi:hypothetical protein
VHQLFHIKSKAETSNLPGRLCIQWGTDYVGYAIYNSSANSLVELGWYSSKNNENLIKELILANPHLQQKYQEVCISFDGNNNVLVPSSLNADDFTSSFYINGVSTQDAVIYENISGRQITNIYSVNHQLLAAIHEYYPSFKATHLKSLLIKNIEHLAEHGLLYVNITNNEFGVVAAKNNQLLLAQNYPYISPNDVLFYLLKICHAHELAQETVLVRLSGFIDKESSLFSGLYQYFLNIDFRDATWTMPDDTEMYPSHLFTTLNHLSICESLQEI